MNPFHMEKMTQLVTKMQTVCTCKICKQRYPKAWCPADEALCFFCTRFNPMKHTRHHILQESKWYVIQSGEDPATYLREYVHHLHLWCNRYSIPYTKADADVEDELLTG